MSPRLKQFMVISLIGLVVVLTALVHFYRQLNQYNLEEHFNTNSRVIATVLRNSLVDDGLMELLGRPGQGQQTPALLARIDAVLRQQLRWVPVVKVKIYDRDAMTVYSSDAAQIGENAGANPGVRSALAGSPLSDIVFRDRFNTFDGVVANRNLHHQYIPLRHPETDAVEGAFEIYSDISELLERIGLQEKVVLSVLAAVLGLFYVALFLVFRRTDRALAREQAKREAYLQELEQVRAELEIRVADRTRELESARVFLQSVIDGIADPLFVIRADLTVSLMNQAARQMIPVDGGPAYRHCYQITHRRDTPCQGADHPCSFSEVLRHGRPVRVRHTHFDRRGEPIIVDVVSTPLSAGVGQLDGIIEVQHDVTELVRTQEGLRASEARLQAIMDHVPDAILGCDRDGRIESVNQSATRLFGASEPELLGRSLSEFIGTGFEELAAERDGSLREVTARRRDGSEFPADMWLGQMAPAGETRHIAVVRDISQRRLAQKELETTRQQYFHQEKMAALGQLAAGILHEVGNPIAAIAGAAAALQDLAVGAGYGSQVDCPFDGALGRNIELIDQQTARLANITREIADFASPRPRERELLDLNGLLQSTARLMSYDRRFRDIDLALELDRSLPAIMGVADQLTQVFMNLLINAMDACTQVPERASRITIRSLHAGNAVQVVVADNGCGMSEEVAAHAREPFYTTKPVGKGTGLGLSLCDTIAHAHGGLLEIESGPDLGTRVTLTLPIGDQPAESDQERAA